MLVSALEGHRLWAATYDAASNPLVALEDRVLPEVLGSVAGLRVVDVACGTGRWMARLADQHALTIGLDLCPQMLERAAGKPGAVGRVALADAARLPVAADAADLVLCSLAVGYFEDHDRAFAEFARAARRGGRVIIADLHPDRVAAGSTRSFRVDGSVYDMRHFCYSTRDLLGAAERARLRLESRRDVPFGEPERHFFREAGMDDVYLSLLHVPALWIASWNKP